MKAISIQPPLALSQRITRGKGSTVWLASDIDSNADAGLSLALVGLFLQSACHAMPILKELSQKYGFKIIIPSNDHEPKHVHIFKGDNDYAKIEIETLKVVRSCLKKNELKRAIEIIKENQVSLAQKWNQIIGG